MSLGAHPRVVAPPETHLFRYPDHATWRAGYPQAGESLRWLVERTLPGLDPNAFADCTPAEVWARVLEAMPDDGWAIDKTPAYAREAAVLARIEATQPHYLWLIRHPLGVVASRIEVWQRRRRARLDQAVADRAPGELVRAGAGVARAMVRRHLGGEVQRKLDYWTDVHARIEAFLAAIPPARQRTLHFEAFVRDPEDQLAPVCEMLELPFDAAMLDPRSALPKGLSAGIGDEKIRHRSGIDPSVADRWRQTLEPSVIDPATRALMGRLGIA